MILISQDGLTTVKPEAVTIESTVKGKLWRIYAWAGGRSYPVSNLFMNREHLAAAYQEIQARMNGDSTYKLNLPDNEDGEALR